MTPLLPDTTFNQVVPFMPTLTDQERALLQYGEGAIALIIVLFVLGGALLKWIHYDSTPPAGAKFLPSVHDITVHDSSFDEEEFLEFARRTFFAVQKARADENPSLVRPFTSKDFWDTFNVALSSMIQANKRTIIEHLKLHKVTLVNAIHVSNWDSITVRVIASCAEYMKDENGHKLGTRRIKSWREDWTFERSTLPESRLRTTWSLTNTQPVVSDRFNDRARRSMSEWMEPTQPKV